MIPLVRRLAKALLWDELAATRWLRGLLLGLAGGGVAFADQIANAVGDPAEAKGIKIIAAVFGLIGGMVTAGERNPPSPYDAFDGKPLDKAPPPSQP